MAENEGQWFVVSTYAGSEDRVKSNLEQRAKTMNIEDMFRVVVPTEEEIEVHEGQRRTVTKKIFPGYILIQMRMNEQTWSWVRNTPGVTGFVGTGSKPIPLAESEVETILNRMEAAAPRVKIGVGKGDHVRICDGPFMDFVGIVNDISPDRGKARVLVSFFGRETPVELDVLQIERL